MNSGPMPPRRGTFQYYVERIRQRAPFTLSRWGDGEWAVILGMSGENCDRHRYSKRLRQDLTAVLVSRPPYDLGLQHLAMKRFGPAIKTWLARRQLSFDWVDSEIFARRSAADQLQPLIDGLATRDVVLVGPARLDALRLFPIVRHIVTPDVNCHDDVARVTAESAEALRPLEHGVLAVSASMSANVIIHRVWAGGFDHHTLVDLGSLWEPYVGLATRTYHKRVLAREAARR